MDRLPAHDTSCDTMPARRILIVDDDQMVRDFCSRLLRLHGYGIGTAQNGAIALQLLSEQTFDLVLTDIQMPVMDGMRLLNEIRARHDDTSVIVFTAYATVETALKALKQGAFDYLTKPVSVNDLERTVRRAFEWQAIQREKKRLTEIVALYEISQTFTATLDTNQAVCEFVGLLRRYFAPETLSISLYHPAEQLLVLLANESPLPAHGAGASVRLLAPPDIQQLLDAHNAISGGAGEPAGSHVVMLALRTNDHTVGALRLTRAAEQPPFELHERHMLAICASQIAASLDNSRLYQQQKAQYLQTISALAALIDARDPYTRGHSEQVMRYAVRLAEAAELSDLQIDRVRIGALLHDIGKIGVRDHVLLKQGGLTDLERMLMHAHPKIGANILRHIKALEDVIPLIEWHHERIDGQGYPHQLCAAQLGIEVRILSIADAFDAMTSDRAYREARPIGHAINELRAGRGTQWDAQLVDLFVSLIEREGDTLYQPYHTQQPLEQLSGHDAASMPAHA